MATIANDETLASEPKVLRAATKAAKVLTGAPETPPPPAPQPAPAKPAKTPWVPPPARSRSRRRRGPGRPGPGPCPRRRSPCRPLRHRCRAAASPTTRGAGPRRRGASGSRPSRRRTRGCARGRSPKCASGPLLLLKASVLIFLRRLVQVYSGQGAPRVASGCNTLASRVFWFACRTRRMRLPLIRTDAQQPPHARRRWLGNASTTKQ